MKLKTCKVCCATKSPTEFPPKRALCIDCYNADQRDRYNKNSTKRIAAVRLYYRENTEQKLAYASNYRKENGDKIKAYKIGHRDEIALSWEIYYEQNRDLLLENGRTYTKNNPGKMNAKNARRRALKLQRTHSWLTEEDKLKIEEFYFYASFMSDTLHTPYEVDHVIPLAGKNISGLHIPQNLQIITAKENRSKGNKFPITQEN